MTAEPKPLQLTEPPENDLQQCAYAFGTYIQAWDQFEIQMLPLFNKLLGTHQNATMVILRSGIDQPTLRAILDAIATMRLSEPEQNQLAALLRRWKTASTKRNRIVHGNWQLSIRMVKGPSGKQDHTKSKFVRFYFPADPTILERIHKGRDQKLRAAHEFSVSDINRATVEIIELAQAMEAFHRRIVPRPFVDPKHITLEQ
jgi:hypothetical protein